MKPPKKTVADPVRGLDGKINTGRPGTKIRDNKSTEKAKKYSSTKPKKTIRGERTFKVNRKRSEESGIGT